MSAVISNGKRMRTEIQNVVSRLGMGIKKNASAIKGRAYPSLTHAITYSLLCVIALLLRASAVERAKAVMKAKNIQSIASFYVF